MFVGQVVERHPDVTEFRVGDLVFGHGGFRSTHVVPALDCQKMAAGMSWKTAIVTPVVRFDELLEEYPNIARDPDNYIKLGVEHASE